MRLQKLTEEHGVEVVHKAFVLRPQVDPRAQFLEYHLQHRFAARLRTELDYEMPAVGSPYPASSWPALEAAAFVRATDAAAFPRYDAALFEAFFAHSRDISDPEVLGDVADAVGIAGREVREALSSGAWRSRVEADHAEAMSLGITGIPAVVIGPHLISGAVPYDTYVRALRDAGAERQERRGGRPK